MKYLSDELLETIRIIDSYKAAPSSCNDMHLHKILYYIRGWVLAVTGEEPFPEKIIKTNNGTRVQELFAWADSIKQEQESSDEDGNNRQNSRDALHQATKNAPSMFSVKAKKVIGEIVDMYGARSSTYLQETSSKDWCVRECEIGSVTPDENIAKRFKEVLFVQKLSDTVLIDGKRLPDSIPIND